MSKPVDDWDLSGTEILSEKFVEEQTGKAMTHVDAPRRLLAELTRVVTSHSTDAMIESCPRRFEFMHLYEMVPEYSGSKFAADVGTAMHEAVQAWSRIALAPEFSDVPRRKFGPGSYAANEGIFALARWWPWAEEDVRRETGKPIGSRSMGYAIELFNKVIQSTFFDDWELVYVDGFGLAIEVPWLIIHTSLGMIPTPYEKEAFLCTQGKIDWILRHRRTGEIRIWDLKTTIKQENVHNAAFKFSGQGPLYSLVLAHTIGHDWQSKGLDMTYMLAQFPTEDSGFHVRPHTFHYSPEDIQDGIDTKLERLLRVAGYARRGNFPRRQHGCDFYGSSCRYLDICSSRDSKYIKKWFEFDVATHQMRQATRHYDPVWIIQA